MSKSGAVSTLLQVASLAVTVAAAVYGGPALVLSALALNVATAAQTSAYQRNKARWGYNASLKDRTLMTASFDGVRSRVYGRARNVDGVVFKGTRGDKSQFYTLVVALAGHEVDAIETVYFNDVALTIDGSGRVTTSPYATTKRESLTSNMTSGTTFDLGVDADLSTVQVLRATGSTNRGGQPIMEEAAYTLSGTVITLALPASSANLVRIVRQSNTVTSKATVRKYTGAAGQDLSGELASRFPGMVTSAHKFAGFACLLVDLEYDDTAFTSGLPNITAVMRGAKVYDPRTGTTAWSQNPALIINDWALYANGGGCSSDEVHAASIIAAANACDTSQTYTQTAQVVSTPGTSWTYVAPRWYVAGSASIQNYTTGTAGASVSYTESTDSSTGLVTLTVSSVPAGMTQLLVSMPITTQLYRCDYVAKLDVSPETHLAEMVESMGGKWGWAGGQLKVRAGAYSTPIAALDDTWLSSTGGSRELVPGSGMSQLINTYRVTIADQTQNWNATQLPALSPSSYLSADGGELSTEIEMGGVSFAPQAMHIAGVLLRDMRAGMTVKWPCNMKAWSLELFDVVTVTSARYGWTAKPLEVVGWGHSPQTGVVLTLKETAASIFNPDAGFAAVDQVLNSALTKPWDLPTITGLVAQSGTDQLLVASDGTIVTRVLLTFAPISSQSVLTSGFIDVEYLDGDTWVAQSFPGNSTSIYLTGLLDGQTYVIKARARSRIASGQWCTQITHKVIGKTEKPPTVDTFTISTQPDGTRLLAGGYSAASRPVDLAGYRIRFRQGAGPFAWSSMTPFQSDAGFFTALPIETNQLLAGAYTLAIVGVDTSGNESDTPLQIVANLPNPRLGDVLTVYDSAQSGWGGTLSGGEADTWDGASIVRASDQATWATLPATWDAWTRWVWYPVASWSYTAPQVDLGVAVAVLPVAAVTCVGNYVVEEQHSSDGASWTSWAAVAASFVARYVRVRITITASGSTGAGVTQITYMSALQIYYTGKVTAETGNDISPAALTGANRIGAGDIRLPLTKAYASISRVSVTLQNVTGNWGVSVVDKSTSGPRVQIYNATGALADPPLIDFTVEGISA